MLLERKTAATFFSPLLSLLGGTREGHVLDYLLQLTTIKRKNYIKKHIYLQQVDVMAGLQIKQGTLYLKQSAFKVDFVAYKT